MVKTTVSDRRQKYTYLFPFHAERARVWSDSVVFPGNVLMRSSALELRVSYFNFARVLARSHFCVGVIVCNI